VEFDLALAPDVHESDKVARLRTQVLQKRTQLEGLLGEWMISGAMYEDKDALLIVLLESDHQVVLSRQEAEARSMKLPPGYALVATPLLREAKIVAAAKQAAGNQLSKRGRGRPPFLRIPHMTAAHGHTSSVQQVFPGSIEEPSFTPNFEPTADRGGGAGEIRPEKKQGSKDPNSALHGKERRQVLKEKLRALGGSVDRISIQVQGVISQRAASASGMNPSSALNSTPLPPLPMTPAPAHNPPTPTTEGQTTHEGGGVSSVVPPSPLPTPAAVNQTQLDAEHAKRIADVVPRQCLSTLRQLMTHKWAFPFNQPVDAEKMGLVDYHKIVTQPMDLGTVKAQIEAGGSGSGSTAGSTAGSTTPGVPGAPGVPPGDTRVYHHPDEMAADVNRTFTNAQKYNPPGSDVHVMAATLLELFAAKWAQVVAPRLQVCETKMKPK
jgi:hypothetical protein